MTTGEGRLDLRAAQHIVWQNKRVKGFNTTDIPYELNLLQGEMAELFEAWRTNQEVDHELADIAIYLLGLSEMLGVDLESAIIHKIQINARRSYEPIAGVLQKITRDEKQPPRETDSSANPRAKLRLVAQHEVLF